MGLPGGQAINGAAGFTDAIMGQRRAQHFSKPGLAIAAAGKRPHDIITISIATERLAFTASGGAVPQRAST